MAVGWNSRGLVLLLLSSFFLALGVLFDQMPIIVDSEIKRNLELATNDLARSLWSQPPVDIHTYYWLFPVRNADKFSNDGESIQVRKVGPFHFTSRMEKRLGPLSANKYRITFNQSRVYKLVESSPEELQEAEFDEELTYLNPIYATIVGSSKEIANTMDEPLRQRLIVAGTQRILNKFNESLFLNTTARAFLLGRPWPVLAAALKLAGRSSSDIAAGPLGPNSTFGLLAIQNATWSGPYEIYTGYQASQGSLGDLISYEGRKRMDKFSGRCARMQTSLGELRPMPLMENQVLELYNPVLCRVLHLIPGGTRRLPTGLAFNYRVDPQDFASASSNPENHCYCLNKTIDNFCSLNGVIEISPCVFYAPLMVNMNGIQLDERIKSKIANWDPDLFRSDPEPLPKVDSMAQFVILKRLAIPMSVDLTIVVLAKVKRDPRFSHTKNVPEESYIPLAMVRELVSIPPFFNQIFVHMENFLLLSAHLKVVFYLSSVVLLCWLVSHFYTQDSLPSDRHQQPPSSSASFQREPSIQQDGRPSENGAATAAARQPPPALIFSKVDELRAANLQKWSSSRVADLPGSPGRRESSPVVGPSPMPKRANGIHPEPTGIEPGIVGPGNLNRVEPIDKVSSLTESEPAKPSAQPVATIMIDSSQCAPEMGLQSDGNTELSLPAESSPKNLLRRKNWIVKIYSNLVNMLGDIRKTISDAGQLDVTENSHQDKQLEMLAGRIDSWQQRLSATTVATSTGDGPANEPTDTASSGAEQPTTGAAAAPDSQPEQAGAARAPPEEAPPVQRPPSAGATGSGGGGGGGGGGGSSSSGEPEFESSQSEQTALNNKEPPKLTASAASSAVEAAAEPAEAANEDKARALEQMELALELVDSSISPAPESAGVARQPSAEPGARTLGQAASKSTAPSPKRAPLVPAVAVARADRSVE